MRLRGHVYNDAGNPVSGAQVEVYTYQGQLAGTTTTGSDGSWTFTNLAPNLYRVKVSYGGIVRWLEGDSEIQVTRLVGSDGQTTPIEPLSVGTNQLQDNAVTTAKLANGAVTYPKLGTPLLVTGSSDSTIRYQESTTHSVSTSWVRLKTFTFNCCGVVYISVEAQAPSGYQVTVQAASCPPNYNLGNGSNLQSNGFPFVNTSTTSTTYTTLGMYLPVTPGIKVVVDTRSSGNTGSVRNLTIRFDPVTDPLQVSAS